MSQFRENIFNYKAVSDVFGTGAYGSVYKAKLKKSLFIAPKNNPKFITLKLKSSESESKIQRLCDLKLTNIVIYYKCMLKNEWKIEYHHIYVELCSSDLKKERERMWS